MMLPGHTPQEHFPGLVALIRAEAERATVPVCLHLDHATNLDQIRMALELGFSSVMIDGSTLSLEENLALTSQVVAEASARQASVEAELGHVGGGDEVLDAAESHGRLTRPEEADRFVAETGVEALAVAIGTAHGVYRSEPNLDFERLSALRSAVPVPLVLHGGSGTPDDQVRRAVTGGICKVNIWTEVALAIAAALSGRLAVLPEELRLQQVCGAARSSAQGVVQQKIRLLGAAGKAG
jgi:ketose-bisphosphate aldolase